MLSSPPVTVIGHVAAVATNRQVLRGTAAAIPRSVEPSAHAAERVGSDCTTRHTTSPFTRGRGRFHLPRETPRSSSTVPGSIGPAAVVADTARPRRAPGSARASNSRAAPAEAGCTARLPHPSLERGTWLRHVQHVADARPLAPASGAAVTSTCRPPSLTARRSRARCTIAGR